MRSKEELMKEVSNACDSGENEYLFLEVLTDIRDQLAEANYYLKPKIIKVK